jgi:hypothetical protein
MYREFAPWFHLLTSPEEYATEAAFYERRGLRARRSDVHDDRRRPE